MKKHILVENELKKVLNKVLSEQQKSKQRKEKVEDVKPRCIPENVIPLSEIVGQADEYIKYSPGVSKRKLGVNSMVDTLGILNNIRLFKDVKDGGSHLAYDMMNHLNRFRNKNFYDETNGECNKAMDKIIELYKENEHGTELVKDIERVLNLQTKDDEYTPSPRAKEYLKQCVNLVKGQ
tara:strand:+ start:13521 stop:14057 length:537 start_codon:yes stop_codon:yes gene_type:complete